MSIFNIIRTEKTWNLHITATIDKNNLFPLC